MQYSLIVAMDDYNGIAKNGDIPWRISEDMKHFKDTTENHVVIMGGNTYRTLPRREPLKNRLNIVISKKELDTLRYLYSTDDEDYTQYKSLWSMGFLFVDSPETACKVCENIKADRPFVIGGKQIYEWFLNKYLIDEMVVTGIPGNHNCDTRLHFPYPFGFQYVITKTLNTKILGKLNIYYYKNENIHVK